MASALRSLRRVTWPRAPKSTSSGSEQTGNLLVESIDSPKGPLDRRYRSKMLVRSPARRWNARAYCEIARGIGRVFKPSRTNRLDFHFP